MGKGFAMVPVRALGLATPAELAVLVAIAAYANRDGVCYPSLSTIGGVLGISRQAVHKHVRQLARKGLLEVQRRQQDNRDAHTTNTYRILYDAPVVSTNQVDTLSTNQVDTLSTNQVDTLSTNQVDTLSTNQVDTLSTNQVDKTYQLTDQENRPREQTTGTKAVAAVGVDTNPDLAAVYTAFERNLGPIPPIVIDDIAEYVERCTAAWVIDAIKVAAERGRRRWDYVRGILNRWLADGRDDAPGGSRPAGPSADSELEDDPTFYAAYLAKKLREVEARRGYYPIYNPQGESHNEPDSA